MANLTNTFWAPDTTVCFGSLEFLSTTEHTLIRIEQTAPQQYLAMLAIAEAAPQARPGVDETVPECRSERLWRYLDATLGNSPTKEDLRCILFAFTNIQGQLVGEDPLSLELLEDGPATGYPHGLHNAARSTQVLMTEPSVIETSTDDMFVGIIEQIFESFLDLLDQGS